MDLSALILFILFAWLPFGFAFMCCFAYRAFKSEVLSREKAAMERMNTTPILSFPARIIRMEKKKAESRDFFITFQSPDGAHKEFAVGERIYQQYQQGDTGELIFLNDLFFSFTPAGKPLPAVCTQDAQCLQAEIVSKREAESFESCFITFDTMERSGWEVRASPQLYETCYKDEAGEIISQNGQFLGFVPQVEEILDPAVFERCYPEQEPDDGQNDSGQQLPL